MVNFSIADVDGTGITFNGTDTFTLNQPGLYHVEYDVNTAENSGASVFNLLQDGAPFSAIGNAATSGGNMGSGAIIQVGGTPLTLQLQNSSGAARTIVTTPGSTISGSASSIRIVRYADGPSV
ncbi:hypothetical protein [Bacillus pumilus]|uniref:hypothetical protein n=1 Tax=Bacillus pumilus TaxID=1408 RepID=UPI002DB9E885|nr:hypothetical protein [Bacillus pumilus]MEC3592639.1 hypothetical protein [Bacillus pumilus]